MHVAFPAPNRRFGPLDALGVVGLVGLLVARFVPVATLIPFWGCTFRAVTGIPCLGCGLTRAAERFTHLNLWGALMANPLGTLGAFGFALCAVLMVLHLGFRVPLPEVTLSEVEWRRVRWGAAALVVANYAFVVLSHRLWHLA
jgi:hypothetical protein